LDVNPGNFYRKIRQQSCIDNSLGANLNLSKLLLTHHSLVNILTTLFQEIFWTVHNCLKTPVCHSFLPHPRLPQHHAQISSADWSSAVKAGHYMSTLQDIIYQANMCGLFSENMEFTLSLTVTDIEYTCTWWNWLFWQNSKLQFMLINRTFLCKFTSSDMILEIV